MKQHSISLLAVAALLALGVLAGRLLLPKIDHGHAARRMEAELKDSYEKRPSPDVPWMAQTGAVAVEIKGMASKDLAARASKICTEPPSLSQSARLQVIAETWKAIDTTAADTFFQTQGAGSGWAFLQAARQAPAPAPATTGSTAATKPASPATAAAVPAGAGQDNVGALREVYSQAAGAEEKSKAAGLLGSALGRWDPAGSAAWAVALADEADRRAAVAGLVSAWAQEEPLAAAEWLVQIPDGAARDAAVSAFARGATRSSPRLALQWALEISDADSRRQIIDRVLKECAQECPAEAKELLSGAGIDPKEREDYLESLTSYTLGVGDHP